MKQIDSRIVHATNPGAIAISFISLWDDLIRNSLDFMLLRSPDYLFFVDSVWVFREEEMDPGALMETARRALFKNLVWSYDDAPYLFGYAAVGYEVRLYAITRVHDDVDAIELGPRGQESRPENLAELFHALANVLQALVKLHAAGWMHRYIQWPNIIKSCDDNSWFLIDFMDAAPSPKISPRGPRLSRAKQAPEIFRDDSHTTAVDGREGTVRKAADTWRSIEKTHCSCCTRSTASA
ncbi:hypothetical protein PHMEG_00024216 [Phytophthora megakarya]|uniref:Protein kinase domain-containing protein n=1 Tax=Phytophthora megakarya TaxID=4795 RepID=A0A225VGH5_9STRA|nr:hypothetical protein PHMEG_00024216 [Phytophthora megakarya]